MARALARPVRLALGLALGLAAGCGPGSEANDGDGPSWPPDTVVAVDGEPVTAAEVDRWLELAAELEPLSTRPRLRRLALFTMVLPAIAARHADPEARRAAEEAARALRARLAAGEPEPEGAAPGAAEPGRRFEGRWSGLGPLVGRAALEVEPDVWHLVEGSGAWYVMRVVEREERGAARLDWPLALDLHVFPWTTPKAQGGPRTVSAAMDAAKLEVVDPAWRDVVPRSWLRVMDGVPGDGTGAPTETHR